MVLVSSLLLLLVVTILALGMFRSYGLQERIAGNVREKQRALHMAVSAQEYGEWWLSQGNASVTPIACKTSLNANLGQGQICRAKPAGVIAPPWTGMTTYTPPTLNASYITSSSPGVGTYYSAPGYWITDLGASGTGSGEVFQVDAYGYGATTTAVAVVESTYQVSPGVIDRGGL
jgi:type IV pilus assembly protein PilX